MTDRELEELREDIAIIRDQLKIEFERMNAQVYKNQERTEVLINFFGILRTKNLLLIILISIQKTAFNNALSKALKKA